MRYGAREREKGFANPFSALQALTRTMPLRDYLCEACGHRQEELIRGPEDEEALSCSACGSPDLSRLISLPAPASGACASDAGAGFG